MVTIATTMPGASWEVRTVEVTLIDPYISTLWQWV